ncbi:hypothetical protein O3P69_002069 [Scylla paramamosain]|uniref:Uncharacterized protein n=1 Tax=Scylla paramamosain TaxID=85552 RepID=A0AAW0V722_SCYPA
MQQSIRGFGAPVGGGVAGEAPLQVVRFMAEGVTTTTSYLDADSSELPDFEEVADWTLLNESLSLKEMKEYVACRGLPGRVRPVLHLDSSLSGWELKGPSLSYNLTVDDVCRRRMLDSLVVFPQRLEKEESVSSEQFPCDNGQCVAQDRRCDQVSDCYDESDEQNCLVISVPDEYQKRVTPPPTSEGALTLLFSLEITSVRNFDLVGFKIGLDMILRVEWKDIRLDFFNLRNRIFSNRVRTYDRIWIPKFYVESDSGSPAEKLQTSPPTLLVRRDHPPRPDDTSRVTKEQVFDGAHNSLVLHKPISITLNCQFYLRTYPFDDQQCSFVYFLYNGNNVSFILNSVMFTGHPQLLEYEVVGTSGVVNNSAVSSFSVVIKFTNQFGYYVGNAFLPSIFLVIICYLTFWFSLDDFQDRIMVSLTSLLVLTGLMTQTSQSIPKTAYLKLIDVWYIALIFMDFMIIVVLAVIENLRQYSSSREVKVMRIHNKHEQKAPFVWLPQPGLGVERKVNVISIVVFPLACIIFIIIYFAISLSYIAN